MLNEKAKQVLELLKEITEECGAFAVSTICWKNEKKLEVQCNVISLREFIEKNNSDFREVEIYDYYKVETSDHRKKVIVELKDAILFAIE